MLTTALHITIGEQVPKLFAISRAEAMARAVARPLYWFTRAFRPFVAALNGASNAILRLLRVNPSAAFEEGGTPEDLKLLIAQSLEGGQLAPDEALMLSGVFELHEQQARQVMTPIPRVVTVDISEDAEAASELCIESGHTRLLVTEDSNPDRIKGIIHANSLLGLVLSEGPKASIAGVVRPALIVPETKPIDTLLAELRRTRNSIAVVVDEYGRTAGIVAIEDIVEEIVGEIADETDPSAGPVRQLKDGEWLVQGDVALADLRDYGIELDTDTASYNSVAGLDARHARTSPTPRRTRHHERVLPHSRSRTREPHRSRADITGSIHPERPHSLAASRSRPQGCQAEHAKPAENVLTKTTLSVAYTRCDKGTPTTADGAPVAVYGAHPRCAECSNYRIPAARSPHCRFRTQVVTQCAVAVGSAELNLPPTSRACDAVRTVVPPGLAIRRSRQALAPRMHPTSKHPGYPDPEARQKVVRFVGLSRSGASRDRTGDLLLAKSQRPDQLSVGCRFRP